MTSAGADFAPGLPDPERFGDTRDLPQGRLLKYVIQKHLAQRSGPHFDVRFHGAPRDMTYSWATKKDWPAPGEKRMLFQQPLHKGSYSTFQGKIVSGYGKGTVTMHDSGTMVVQHADPNKINFTILSGKHPETYSMIRRGDVPTNLPRAARTQGGSWLLINTTPMSAAKMMGGGNGEPEDVGFKKMKYTSIPAEKVDKVFDPKYLVQEKIDGACFPPGMKVLTDKGWLRIDDIVNQRLPVMAASRLSDGSLVWRRVTNYWKYEKTESWTNFRVWTYPRKAVYVSCTPGHKILTPSGMKQAGQLRVGDAVYALSARPSVEQQQILEGWLLSDGCIRKDGSIQLDQCLRRKQFMKTSLRLLKGLGLNYWEYVPTQGFSIGGGACRIKTSRIFSDLRRLWYGADGKKRVPSNFKLTPLSAAFWYQGDGSVSFQTRGIRNINTLSFHTDGFDEKSVSLLAQQLRSQGFACRIYRVGTRLGDGEPRFVIQMAAIAAKRFIEWVRPYVCPIFRYKLLYGKVPCSDCGFALRRMRLQAETQFVPTVVDLIRNTPANRGQWGNCRFVYDLEVEETRNYVVQGVVVSNSALFHVLHDKIHAVSYRTAKTGQPIVHSYRIFGPGGVKPSVKLAPELEGSILRGEIYGEREGEAIPPQELGGLLNSSTVKSLEDQARKKIQLKVRLFDIARLGDETVPPLSMGAEERMSKLKEIAQYLPKNKFSLPETATTPEEAKALWGRITSGKNPLTSEGVVAWPKAPGKPPIKVKQYPESDVWIRKIFPGEKRLKDVGAGGFEYSHGPESPIVGRVGTGFDEETRRTMVRNPEDWVGRLARVKAQSRFSSGALRAPVFIARHEDVSPKAASLSSICRRRKISAKNT